MKFKTAAFLSILILSLSLSAQITPCAALSIWATQKKVDALSLRLESAETRQTDYQQTLIKLQKRMDAQSKLNEELNQKTHILNRRLLYLEERPSRSNSLQRQISYRSAVPAATAINFEK